MTTLLSRKQSRVKTCLGFYAPKATIDDRVSLHHLPVATIAGFDSCQLKGRAEFYSCE